MSEENLGTRPLPSRQELHQILVTYFNESELKDICFQLNIEWEDISGTNKKDKARELVAFVERHQREKELATHIFKMRPHAGLSITEEATKRLHSDDPLLIQFTTVHI
jgi:hypothetical protein